MSETTVNENGVVVRDLTVRESKALGAIGADVVAADRAIASSMLDLGRAIVRARELVDAEGNSIVHVAFPEARDVDTAVNQWLATVLPSASLESVRRRKSAALALVKFYDLTGDDSLTPHKAESLSKLAKAYKANGVANAVKWHKGSPEATAKDVMEHREAVLRRNGKVSDSRKGTSPDSAIKAIANVSAESWAKYVADKGIDKVSEVIATLNTVLAMADTAESHSK